MNTAALIIALCLTQAEGDAPAEAPAEAPAAAETGPAESADVPTLQTSTQVPSSGGVRSPHLEAVRKMMLKVPSMTPEEQKKAYEEIRKMVGSTTSNPVLPPEDFDLGAYSNLTDEDQVKVTARRFFEDVVAGNAGAAVGHAGFPFLLENRRFDRPDELRTEIARHLRSKRTDLLKLYDVEVLTPQDMEKKYGKAPARLNSWPLKAPKTYLAVGNLSGRAVVLLFRQAGLAWQAVGWHD